MWNDSLDEREVSQFVVSLVCKHSMADYTADAGRVIFDKTMKSTKFAELYFKRRASDTVGCVRWQRDSAGRRVLCTQLMIVLFLLRLSHSQLAARTG